MTKQLLFTIFAAVFTACGLQAAPVVAAPANTDALAPAIPVELAGVDGQMTPEDFLSLTPRKIREATGKKLTLKETLGLKLAQKKIKKQLRKAKKGKREEPDIPKGLFILCAILVPIVPIIFMGIADDWQGSNWWVAFLLYALCYLPGLIFTLTKVKDYYPNKK